MVSCIYKLDNVATHVMPDEVDELEEESINADIVKVYIG
jgi:hypothetical protein